MPDVTLLTRRVLIGALAAAGTCACFGPLAARTTPRAPTLRQLVARNTRARGGAAALDRMRSLAIDVEIQEGGLTLNGHYAAAKSGQVRIDVYADGKHVGSEGVDTKGVWILGKNGPEPSVATGAANALTNGAESHLYGWNRFAEGGRQLALMPSENIAGIIYPVVEVRYSTGHVSYFHVDPTSWLAVRRRDERAYHPDVNTTKQRVETRFSQFINVEGLVAPHINEDFDLTSGKLLSTNRVLARRINPALAADYFDRNHRAPAAW